MTKLKCSFSTNPMLVRFAVAREISKATTVFSLSVPVFELTIRGPVVFKEFLFKPGGDYETTLKNRSDEEEREGVRFRRGVWFVFIRESNSLCDGSTSCLGFNHVEYGDKGMEMYL